MPGLEPQLTGVGRVEEGRRRERDQRHVAQACRHLGRGHPARASRRRSSAPSSAPRPRRRAAPTRSPPRPRRRPGRTCSQRNRPSPLIRVTASMISGPMSSTEPPTSTCPWSAVTTSAAPGGSTSSTSPTRRSTAPQLVVVVRAQTLGVGHLVDALVVGVDERGPAGRQLADGRDEPGGRVPAVEVDVAQVRRREPGRSEVLSGHDRDRSRALRGRTGSGWNLDAGTDIRASTPRSDHWRTFMTSTVERHPVADHAVLRGHPSRSRASSGRRPWCSGRPR